MNKSYSDYGSDNMRYHKELIQLLFPTRTEYAN